MNTDGPDRLPVPGLAEVSERVIYPHVFGNADREVGGVLVGRAAGGELPRVNGAIPAISADEQRSTLTFTQDSWEHVHKVLETEYPEGEQIVGWYHSHPGFGIFLSGHDLFIHENFFSSPSQIAVVVDPLGCTDGTFVWRDEEISKLYEYPTPEGWVADRSGGQRRVVVDEEPPTIEDEHAPADRRRLWILVAIVAMFLGLAAILLFSGGDDERVEREGRTRHSASGELTRPQVVEYLRRGVEVVERSGAEAVAAFRYLDWPESEPTVIVGQLRKRPIELGGLIDSSSRTWLAGDVIAFAGANRIEPASTSTTQDPFAGWRAESRSISTAGSAAAPATGATVGSVPGRFVYFAAYRGAAKAPTAAAASSGAGATRATGATGAKIENPGSAAQMFLPLADAMIATLSVNPARSR